jgi:hypothetical protein
VADLGKNTEKSLRADPGMSTSQPALLARAFQLGGERDQYAMGVARNDSDGNPSAPCQSQPRPSVLKDIFWRVNVGSNTLEIDCKYTGTAPRIIIRANPSLGLQADHTVTAGAGSGWVTLSYTFTATAKGVVNVWRERLDGDITHTCLWDHLVVS